MHTCYWCEWNLTRASLKSISCRFQWHAARRSNRLLRTSQSSFLLIWNRTMEPRVFYTAGSETDFFPMLSWGASHAEGGFADCAANLQGRTRECSAVSWEAIVPIWEPLCPALRHRIILGSTLAIAS